LNSYVEIVLTGSWCSYW